LPASRRVARVARLRPAFLWGAWAQVPGANHAVLIGAQGTGNFTDHFTDHFTDRFITAPTQSLRPGNAAITLPRNAVFA
jgi:hypothetical protein